MRIVLTFLALLPLPATAWEFSFDDICRLTHTTAQSELLITYDPNAPEYALSIYLNDAPWAEAATFEMVFIGPQPFSIGTGQHGLTLNNQALIVRDKGFGNVLDGLEFNETVVSRSGETTITYSLNGAAPAVQAFRACPADAPATS